MIQLDDWQKEVLKEKGNILLCSGRQIGKTQIFAMKAVEEMLKDKITIMVISLTEDQAMINIAYIINYLREKYPRQIKKETLKSIELENGSLCISRPVGNTGDATRGFAINILWVDEAAKMNQLFWIASLPTLLTKQGRIWLCSTPRGKKGYFYERFKEAYIEKIPEAQFKAFYKTTEEVINSRPISKTWTQEQKAYAIRRMAEDKKDMTKNQYAQEYLGEFTDDLNQFFPEQWIKNVCQGKRYKTETNTFMGCDIARLGGDKIVYTNMQKQGNKVIQTECIIKEGQQTTSTYDDLIFYAEKWNNIKVGIDAGSGALGVGIWDFLMRHPVMKYKVIAMNNREISMDREGNKKQRIFKEDMYDNLKAMGDRGDLVLLDDEKIKDSLRSIQLEYDEITQNIKIWGLDNHAAEAIVRGAWLASKQKINKLWISYI